MVLLQENEDVYGVFKRIMVYVVVIIIVFFADFISLIHTLYEREGPCVVWVDGQVLLMEK